ncbi:MAG TPA: type VI secretion system-associated protein TagF [Gammaproteobacteria bacterium]|nr:type VI secretion system-associated protein TagF [Gammaproteobacteria bacterium]
MNVSSRPGFYGKMPARGDFVSRRVASDFMGPWDAWLQAGLAASRQALGGEWLEVYLTSPIWRFALAPGCCGEQGQAGVMMPSVDRVGRYFPLAAVLPLGAGAISLACAVELDAWYSQVEELLLTTLAETPVELEEFDGRLAELLPRPRSAAAFADAAPSAERVGMLDGSGAAPRHFGVSAGASLHEVLETLGGEALERQGWRAFWWTQGSERVRPCFLMAHKLPAGQPFAAMLDGGFRRHGWVSKLTDEEPPHDEQEQRGEHEQRGEYEQRREDEQRTEDEQRREPNRYCEPPQLREPAQPAERVPHNDLTQPRTRRLVTRSAAVTDVGKRRERNEDAYACRDDLGVWLVADGLGGHQAGEIASRMVTSTLRGLSAGSSLPDRIEQLVRALGVVNGCLQVLAERDPAVTLAGSTVVALLIESSAAAVMWAGDSRLYRFRDGVLQPLTRDHSEAVEGSGNHVITRAVGGPEALEVEIEHAEVREGDRFLLCTDGLYGEVGETEIAAALSGPAPGVACEDLKRAALKGEARDNLTAVVVFAGWTA